MNVGEIVILLIIGIVALVALIIAIVAVARDVSLTYKVVGIDKSSTVSPLRNTIYKVTGTTPVTLTFGTPVASNTGIQIIIINTSSQTLTIAGSVSPPGRTLKTGTMALVTTTSSGDYYLGYLGS